MKINYSDITKKLGTPIWWDTNGVPRYKEFSPHLATIYGDEVVLFKIACQNCYKEYIVSIDNESVLSGVFDVIEALILNKNLHYGDPPNTNCCLAGSSMNSHTLEVLQYWKRENFLWQRNNKLEVVLSTISALEKMKEKFIIDDIEGNKE